MKMFDNFTAKTKRIIKRDLPCYSSLSLFLTISLSFCLPVCLSSVDTLDIDFTHGQKYEQNKTHVCKTRSRMRAFHFQCNDNSVARGRHLRVPPSSSSSCNCNSRSHLPFYLLSVCSSKTIFHYILSSLTLTQTHTQTGTQIHSKNLINSFGGNRRRIRE